MVSVLHQVCCRRLLLFLPHGPQQLTLAADQGQGKFGEAFFVLSFFVDKLSATISGKFYQYLVGISVLIRLTHSVYPATAILFIFVLKMGFQFSNGSIFTLNDFTQLSYLLSQ